MPTFNLSDRHIAAIKRGPLRQAAGTMNGPTLTGTDPQPYIPALDGLRALAVGSVLLYHAGQAWLPGGFLGVEIFFVISGYLITSLLLAEWSAQGSIDLPDFWWRRVRRLLPALFALLLAVVGYAVLFLPDELAGLRGDAVSGTLYVNNWYQIFSHHSYFESTGRPSLLHHLWSLAVEEQFYLVWPLLFCLLMRAPRLLGTCGVAATGALATVFAMLGVLLFAAEAPPPPASFASTPPPAVAPTNVLPAAQDFAAPTAHVAVAVLPCATTPVSPVPDASVTAIGDSVMLGVREQLLRVLGSNVLVDAELGRQPRQVPALLRRLRAAGQIHPVVILHLGDNGIFSESVFDRIMAELAEAREVLIVNVKVPRQWETPNNEMLAEAVKRYPNAVLVDWHAASVNRPGIFWKDGLHLRPEGAVVYADLIERALHGGGAHSALAGRQAETERRPLPEGALDRDRSLMMLDNALRNREAQPAAIVLGTILGLRRKEPVEHLGQV